MLNKIVIKLYIPIWLYSNFTLRTTSISIVLLYIPIWLYSNCMGNNLICRVIRFTFQSGYIQMSLEDAEQITDTALHSNLVIFK